MAPDAAVDPSQPPATHLSTSHRIASIKSSQMKASQHTACYRSRTTPHANDSQTTQPQYPDTAMPLDKAATLRRSRTSQRDHSDTMHVHTSAQHKTTTQQRQTASECREWHTGRTATRRCLTAETWSRYTAARITGVDTHHNAGTASEGGYTTTMQEQLDVS